MSNDVGAIINGFRFQIDSAVYIFVKYLKDIEKLGLEKNEDIHVLFCNGEATYIQSKAVKNPSLKDADSGKLKDAIKSLKKHNNSKIRNIIYNTNQHNPITIKDSSFSLGKIDELPIYQLSVHEMKKIKRYIDENHPLFNKLSIIKLPYEPSDYFEETKKHILNEIRYQLSQMDINQIIAINLLNTWHSVLENSGTYGNYITKERFTWIIVGNLLQVKLVSCEAEIENPSLMTYLLNSLISDFKTFNIVRSMYDEHKIKYSDDIEHFVTTNFDELITMICPENIDDLVKPNEMFLIIKNLFELEKDIVSTKKGAGIK